MLVAVPIAFMIDSNSASARAISGPNWRATGSASNAIVR